MKSETLSLKNYYKKIRFSKESNHYSMKHLKKIIFTCTQINKKTPDPRNDKEHCQSFNRKEKHKIGKTIKNN